MSVKQPVTLDNIKDGQPRTFSNREITFPVTEGTIIDLVLSNCTADKMNFKGALIRRLNMVKVRADYLDLRASVSLKEKVTMHDCWFKKIVVHSEENFREMVTLTGENTYRLDIVQRPVEKNTISIELPSYWEGLVHDKLLIAGLHPRFADGTVEIVRETIGEFVVF